MRGVDFGLGIGYNPESNNSPSSNAVSSHPVNPLRTGTGMAQFKSKFVAASSSSENQGVNSSSSMYANKKMLLPGFVSGGVIGGERRTAPVTSSTNAGAVPTGYASTPNARENTNQKNLER